MTLHARGCLRCPNLAAVGFPLCPACRRAEQLQQTKPKPKRKPK